MRGSTFRIPWRNLWRNRKRTALAVLAITVGQGSLLMTQGLMRGYADNVQNAITGPMTGHIQIHHPDYREEQALDLYVRNVPEKINIIKQLPEVQDAAARIYAPVLLAPEEQAFIATVVGLDVESESEPFGLLSGSGTQLTPGHVMLGYRLARKSGAQVGDKVALVGQAVDGSLANDLFIVQAIIDGPVDLVNQSGVIMTLDEAQTFLAMPEQAHEILIRAENLDDVELALSNLQKLPALEGLEIASWRELVPELVLIIDMVNYAGWFILAIVLVAALAGIVNTLMMATYERMHEFGMLLALGCRPRRIVSMIIVEAIFLGMLGITSGSVAGIAFVEITQETGIDMSSWGGEQVEDLAYGGMRLPLKITPRLEPQDPLMGLLPVLIVSLLAAAWPASVAAKLDPMEAMRS